VRRSWTEGLLALWKSSAVTKRMCDCRRNEKRGRYREPRNRIEDIMLLKSDGEDATQVLKMRHMIVI
jgi:hypothetical protein